MKDREVGERLKKLCNKLKLRKYTDDQHVIRSHYIYIFYFDIILADANFKCTVTAML